MTNLAIFASGKGSNTDAIIRFFRKSNDATVALIVSNNANAGVVEVANRNGIPVEVVTKQGFYGSTGLLETLRRYNVSFIALAGFIWLIPMYILNAFPGKIVNVHPALLPKHGGKGMFGTKVHEAVLKSKDTETGITVHHVNDRFDEGEIIFQAKCTVDPNDNAGSLEAKVQKLEHLHYPKVIEKLLINETANI